MENPRSHGAARELPIDTIVVHHTSALNWDDKAFQGEHGERLRTFEQALSPPVGGGSRTYDWRYCKQIFEVYGVSSHYLIARDGTIYQLVPDEQVAFHAGDSKMPEPDGREGVNKFSIGIELIATHPDDDPTVFSGQVAAYTSPQMDSLVELCAVLNRQYRIPIRNIVGHDAIAPGRKKDPGRLFDWDSFKTRLSSRIK